MLPHHDGKCRRLHGHSFKMRVVVQGNDCITSGPKAGMVVDYAEISRIVKPLVESKLDHYYLNETTGLENPTSELLAVWVYKELSPLIPNLVAIEIDETCTSYCRYQPWRNPELRLK